MAGKQTVQIDQRSEERQQSTREKALRPPQIAQVKEFRRQQAGIRSKMQGYIEYSGNRV